MRVYASNSIYEQETRERYDKPFITHSFITRVANPVLTKIIYQIYLSDLLERYRCNVPMGHLENSLGCVQDRRDYVLDIY